MTAETFPAKHEFAYGCFVTMNDIFSAFMRTSNWMSLKVLDINERGQTISRTDRIYRVQGCNHTIQSATQEAFARAWFCNNLKDILHISDDLLKQKKVSAKEWSSFFNNTSENTLSRGLLQQTVSRCLSKKLIYEQCSRIQRMIEEQVWSIMRHESKRILTNLDVADFESKERLSNAVQNASLIFEETMMELVLPDIKSKIWDNWHGINLSSIYNTEIDPVIRLAMVTFISLFRESDIEKHDVLFKDLFENLFEVKNVSDWEEYSTIYSCINRRSLCILAKKHIEDRRRLFCEHEARYVAEEKCFRIMRKLLAEHNNQIKLVKCEETKEQLLYQQFDKFGSLCHRWSDDPIPLYVDLSQAPKEYCEMYQNATCTYVQESILGQVIEGILKQSPFDLRFQDQRKIKSEVRATIDDYFGQAASNDLYAYELILDGFCKIPNIKIQRMIPNPWINDYEVNDFMLKLLHSEIEQIIDRWKNVQVTLFVPETFGFLDE